MIGDDTHRGLSNNPWYRLAVAAGFALATLLAIGLIAIELADRDQSNYQRVVFDGYKYFPEQNVSVDRFRSETELSNNANTSSEHFTSAMSGEHWLWFSPDRIDPDLEILQIELAWLDKVSIYFFNKEGDFETYEAGDDDRFSARIISFRKPAFPLLRELNQSEVTAIALSISAQGRFSMPLYAVSEKAFNAQLNLDYLFYGAWIAILLALGFYNASIFFSLRYNVHLYYVLYVIVFSALLIIASGIGQQYIWPNHKNTTTLLANIALALTNYGTAFFVINFIRLEDYNKTLTKLLKGLSYISVLCIPLVFFFKYDGLPPILISSFAIMAIILPAAVYATLKGNHVAPFLFASLIVLLPCNTIGLIRFMGYFDNAHWTEHIAELGMVADALILSLALAYMVNLLRGEKDKVTNAREQERVSFAKQLLHAKEEERKVIGKALHDDLGHKILSIKNSVTQIPEQSNQLHQTKSLTMLDEAIEQVRDLSHLLYPSIIEHLGLEKAISNAMSTGLNGTDIKYTLAFSTLNASDELELLIYRAAQEFVNNLLKHSTAKNFALKISKKADIEEITVSATDDGETPFTTQEFGFGLNMLKQQAALFDGDLGVTRSTDGLNIITLTVFDKQRPD